MFLGGMSGTVEKKSDLLAINKGERTLHKYNNRNTKISKTIQVYICQPILSIHSNFYPYLFFSEFRITACAPARRANGTLYGEHDT